MTKLKRWLKMNIQFSRKEEKEDTINMKESFVTYCYMMAIAKDNKILWQQLKNLIENIDKQLQNQILSDPSEDKEDNTKGDNSPSSI